MILFDSRIIIDHNLRDRSQLYGASGSPLAQASDTKDRRGYNVLPSSFLFEAWNRQYTHQSGGAAQFSAFGTGGSLECPYAAQHGSTYSASTHMDRADSSAAGKVPTTGVFNGVRVVLQEHSFYRDGAYWLNISFMAPD